MSESVTTEKSFYLISSSGLKTLAVGTKLRLIDITHGNKPYYYTVESENMTEVKFSDFKDSAGKSYVSQPIRNLVTETDEGEIYYSDMAADEQETEELCLEYNIDLNETKKWYNGYNVDDIAIYNPRSVTEACRRKRFTNYWSKTETYNALKTPINLNFDGLKEKVEKMIAGDKIGVNTAKFQNDMTSMKSADDILTLLIHWINVNKVDKKMRKKVHTKLISA